MKMKVILAAACLALAAPARADEIVMTADEAYSVQSALMAVARGAQKIVKDADKTTVVFEPYEFTPAVRIAMAKNIVRVGLALEPVTKEVQAVRAQLCKDTECAGDAKQKLLDEVARIGREKVKIDLITLSEGDMNLAKNTGLDPMALKQLTPILPFMK